MNEWFTPANILQMIYILGTLLLSYLIWRATQEGAKATKAATEASKASLELAKKIQAKQVIDELLVRRQYRKAVYTDALFLLHSAEVLKKAITTVELEKLPPFDVENTIVAKCFNPHEQALIQKAKINQELIRQNLFKDGKPSFQVNEANQGLMNEMYRLFKELTEEIEKAPL